SRSTTSRRTAWRLDFIGKRPSKNTRSAYEVATGIHRLLLIFPTTTCINILSDAYGRTVTNSEIRRWRSESHPCGGRRRHWIHGPGTAPPPLAASGGHDHGGDVVGGHGRAQNACARTSLQGRSDAARSVVARARGGSRLPRAARQGGRRARADARRCRRDGDRPLRRLPAPRPGTARPLVPGH